MSRFGDYQLAAIDKDLNLSGRCDSEERGGFTIYTYKESSTFKLIEDASLIADVLVIGGGGSGGGGFQGGGGGAGGFVDKHNFPITGNTEGEVVIGEGGAEVPYDEGTTEGNAGENSSFSTLIAYGGGYGSCWPLYTAGDGASGGGGDPYSIFDTNYGPGVDFYHGLGGKAIHGHQGHDGSNGYGSTSWYHHTAGGGGGAGWPGFMATVGGMCGGMGRPCDIAGQFQPPGGDPMEEIYEEAGWTYIPWFCGGGAGRERPNNWSYRDGEPGMGGGGSAASAGEPNTGGGGGGNGWLYGPPFDPNLNGRAWGPAGGSGIVIIRINTSDESLVLNYGEAEIRRIATAQDHSDVRGDYPPIQIHGWPTVDGELVDYDKWWGW